MADVFGLSDVSTKDTGSGSKLKTGNLKGVIICPEKKLVINTKVRKNRIV